MSLRESIDRDPTGAPADPFDLDLTLRRGRRVVRRRRTVAALTGTAATVVLATALTAGLSTSGDPVRDTAVASRGSEIRCPAAEGLIPECTSQVFRYDNNVTVTSSGKLVVRAGWSVTRRVEDPIANVRTVAVAVSDGTEVEWALIEYPDANGDAFAEHTGPRDFPGVAFDDWLDYAKSRWTGEGTTAVVRFNQAGELVAQPGWSISQQATGLTMPAGYRGPADVTAVVQVLGPKRSGGWYLVRHTPTGAEAFPVVAWDGGMEGSIEGVLEYASSSYVLSEQGFLRGSS